MILGHGKAIAPFLSNRRKRLHVFYCQGGVEFLNAQLGLLGQRMGRHDRAGAKHVAPALPLILVKSQGERFALGLTAKIRDVIHQRHMGGEFSWMSTGHIRQKVVVTGNGGTIGKDGILLQSELNAALVAAGNGRKLFSFNQIRIGN